MNKARFRVSRKTGKQDSTFDIIRAKDSLHQERDMSVNRGKRKFMFSM
ncbi:hypothetical protein CCACVL1_29485 [Corchorus capsularis]|uniref:Uncharacterized protein n=1 Tax=Corchorus capsularis TaxID=210143 RepID=A0A1R3G1J5_COCAP|nr:hypothetical protein CCACVL1_29485 [Corchorus capsularis]